MRNVDQPPPKGKPATAPGGLNHPDEIAKRRAIARTAVPVSDLLREILDTIQGPKSTQHHEHLRALQAVLRERFAALNGWIPSKRWFAISQLARSSPRRKKGEHYCYGLSQDYLDHCEFFRDAMRPLYPTALAAHVYRDPVGRFNRDEFHEECASWARSHGLLAHVPPDPLSASWWYPGRSALVVYTAPSVSVTWLRGEGEK